MRKILQIVSWIALLGVIIPPCIFLGGGMELSVVKVWILASSVLWFATVPFWMGRTQ